MESARAATAHGGPAPAFLLKMHVHILYSAGRRARGSRISPRTTCRAGSGASRRCFPAPFEPVFSSTFSHVPSRSRVGAGLRHE